MSAEAERFRQARLEFAEAMERGCSIPELRRIKARARHAEAIARLEARQRCGRRASDPAPLPRSAFLPEDEPRSEPWMMRD